MTTLCRLLLLSLLASTAFADVITQWTFDSNPPDASTSTGTNAPSTGTGTTALFGVTFVAYASGSAFVSGTDNTAWNLGITPPQGTSNKMAGVEFQVSTVGFEDIVVTWDQQNSGNSSKYTRFQYTLDGTNFIDGPVIDATVVGSFVPRSVSLSGVVGANDNPNFAIRLVAEFESTAVGGADLYRPSTATATYGSSGRVRFDNMTVSGNPPTGNTPPTISTIPNQTMRANGTLTDIPFQVSDAETPVAELIVSAASSNPAVVRDDGLLLGGSGAERTISIFPADFDVTGTTTITLAVFDGGNKSNSTSFVVTILPENTAPRISAFTNYHTLMNTTLGPIAFTVSDAETEASSLIVAVDSSSPETVPTVVLGGTGTNRTLTITPATNKHGTTAIRVTASDGSVVTTNIFNVMVLASASIVLDEPFNYENGSLTTNSGGLWATHSGTIQQTQVDSGTLQLQANRTEDVNARLVGGPFEATSNARLYARLRVNYSNLPGNPGEYFALFRDLSGGFRARVYGSTSNTTPGMVRFGLANNSSSAANIVLHPTEFNLGEEQRIVVMYDVAASQSKLWVNPSSEADPSITATDNPSTNPIGTFAFRQNTGLGNLTVDDVLIGLSFDDVVDSVRLTIVRSASEVELSWPSSATMEGYVLEWTSNLANPDWQLVDELPASANGRDTVTITNPTGTAYYRLSNSGP